MAALKYVVLLALSWMSSWTTALSATTTRNTQLKREILELSRETANGLRAEPWRVSAIAEKASLLSSPVPSMATSELVSGRWRLAFTTTTGPSAGKLGPFVGDVYQAIDARSASYVNELKFPFFDAKLTARFQIRGENEWQVIFDTLTFFLFSTIPVATKQVDGRGVWRMTYVDDDFRVLFAKGDTRTEENIYILEKVD
mmetsp:Transcript_19688/g.63287  ORF Transcript_19688/g.63287 Transcript_19688/m.63287 type:complete len:199 (+) Transcript_19688:1071-1667(+)